MKHFAVAILASIFFGFGAFADSHFKSHEQTINIGQAFVPSSFSSDVEAYVFVSGVYPNGCYSFSRYEVSCNDPMTHEIRIYANVSEAFCTMALVPYQLEVRLGHLAKGEHTLRFVNGDNTYFEHKLLIE